MINGIYERPDGLDAECVKLVDFLNNIDHVQTYESCCGHLKNKYMIFLYCNDFATLAKLFRAVNFNYSDGKWILEVDGTDTHPTYCFSLHSREPFKDADEMDKSINALIENVQYWLNPKFAEYFQYKPQECVCYGLYSKTT